MAGRGPLPTKNPRRRNKPTIPTTELPARGRKGAAPKPPVPLGKRSGAWWKWAWSLPQAAGWSDGDLYALTRRALLEDDLEAIELVDGFNLGWLIGADDERQAVKQLEAVIGKLKALAGGKLGILREARELDNRFGLTAKGLADLRWKIVAEVEDEVAKKRNAKPARRRVEAVDASAVAGG